MLSHNKPASLRDIWGLAESWASLQATRKVKHMTHKFITMVLSASLAMSAITTTPVRASESDILKALIGIGVIAALGTAINKEKHRKRAEPSRQVTRNQRVGDWLPKENFKRERKVAPTRCARTQWTHRGNREVYSARCMQRHAKAQLPDRCLRRANTNEGPRRFYTKQCLRKNGWRA